MLWCVLLDQRKHVNHTVQHAKKYTRTRTRTGTSTPKRNTKHTGAPNVGSSSSLMVLNKFPCCTVCGPAKALYCDEVQFIPSLQQTQEKENAVEFLPSLPHHHQPPANNPFSPPLRPRSLWERTRQIKTGERRLKRRRRVALETGRGKTKLTHATHVPHVTSHHHLKSHFVTFRHTI